MSKKINYNNIAVDNAEKSDTNYSRALEICWLAVILLVPIFFNPSSHQAFYLNKALLLQFLVSIMLAISVAAIISSSKRVLIARLKSVVNSPLIITVIIFGLIAVVTTVVSITPSVSFWGSYYRKAGLLNLICWILFFIILAFNMRNKAQIIRALYTLLISSALVSLFGVLTHFLPDILLGYGHGLYRVSSTIGNSLSLSIYIAMIIPINMAFIMWLWEKRIEGKNVFILCGLVVLLILQFWCLWLAQYSVTILLYIIAPLLFIALFGIVQNKKIIAGFGIGFVLIVGVIAVNILVPLFLNDSESKPDNREFSPVISAENLGLDTVGRRAANWKNTIELVLESPEVPFSNDRLSSIRTYIGYGPETFIVTYQRYYPNDLNDYQSLFLPPLSRPHNQYLYLAATNGLIGLASFLSIIFIFLWIGFSNLLKTKSLLNRLLFIALIAGILQYCADSIFNPLTIASELVFWFYLGLVLIIGKVGLDKDDNQTYSTIDANNDKTTGQMLTPGRIRSYISAGCAILVITMGINIVIRPFLADIQFQRGLQLQSIRDIGALTAYEKAVELEPEQAVYWGNIGAMSYSAALQAVSEHSNRELLELSTNAYERALVLERYVSYRYYPLADVYTYWAKEGAVDKWSRAMLLYDRASQLSPRNMIILNKWAHALVVKGDLEQAGEKIDRAKELNEYWIGNALISALILSTDGKYQNATDEIIFSIEELPDGLQYCESIFYEMAIYETVGTLHKALEQYSQEFPDEWIHHAMLGFTSLFIGEPDRSIEEFDTAMHLVPDEYAGDLFISIKRFSSSVPYISFKLPEVASKWRPKLSRTVDSDTMIRILDDVLNK